MRSTLRSLLPSKHFLDARLLHRLQRFHSLDHGYSSSAIHEQSNQVLRWMSESATSEKQLLHMVREYTELHKPLAYILGTQPFGPLEILVESPILIPRPETEHWATLLVEKLRSTALKRPLRILDLCSGSGCISLLLAHQLPDSTVLGLDVLPQAVQLARTNASKYNIRNASFSEIDIFDDTALLALRKEGLFDCIVSNPPYIPRSEYKGLDRSVKEHESPLALLGEYGQQATSGTHDGLDFYRRIKDIYPTLMKDSREADTPRLVVEVGKGQAEAVAAMFSGGRRRPEIEDDCAGIGRSIWVYN